MALTRSAVLGAGNAAAGVSTHVWTVPASEKALVKSATLQVLGSVSDCYLRAITPAGTLNLFNVKSAADFDILYIALWHVLEPGYELQVLSQQTNFTFYISGTRLLT